MVDTSHCDRKKDRWMLVLASWWPRPYNPWVSTHTRRRSRHRRNRCRTLISRRVPTCLIHTSSRRWLRTRSNPPSRCTVLRSNAIAKFKERFGRNSRCRGRNRGQESLQSKTMLKSKSFRNLKKTKAKPMADKAHSTSKRGSVLTCRKTTKSSPSSKH